MFIVISDTLVSYVPALCPALYVSVYLVGSIYCMCKNLHTHKNHLHRYGKGNSFFSEGCLLYRIYKPRTHLCHTPFRVLFATFLLVTEVDSESNAQHEKEEEGQSSE
ncbi:hypothetical protein FKM82_023841 [Ascaphus truei]